MDRLSTLFMVALFLIGCSDSTNYDFDQSVTEAQASFNNETIKAEFNPSPEVGKIPPINDILFLGSKDGTLNIPLKESGTDGQKAVKAALNDLDGFSTISPITTTFSAPVDPDSIKLGESVRVFELQKTGTNVTGIGDEVTSPTNLVAKAIGNNNTTLAILPTQPLKPKTGYLVVLTNGLKGAGGATVTADTAYLLAKGSQALTGDFAGLEPLRKVINGLENLAASKGIQKDSIVLSWSFTTQSIGDVMQKVYQGSKGGSILTQATGKSTKAFFPDVPSIAGKADVYTGILSVPYYLETQTKDNPKGPITGFWKGANGSALTQFNSTPVKTQDIQIPVLITVPNAKASGGGVAPQAGWPVVIFQHGIGGNRSSMLPIADAYADAGFMVVAIDLVLHGIVDTSDPLHVANSLFANAIEPSMGLDFANNERGTPGPDGKPDVSGTHFINLGSLLTARDNIRQSVSNLFVLRKSLASMADAGGGVPIPTDSDTVRFAGHSLGGIVGTDYLAFDDTVGAASLFMPGGGIAPLLNGSKVFGEKIREGLKASGIEAGTPEFQAFLIAAQTVLDAADPINLGAKAAQKHPIHMIEVVGGNSSEPDASIPNRVEGAPLSGTEPLAAVMHLPNVTVPGTSNSSGIVRFTAGEHGSILNPKASPESTREMQAETAMFLSTNGRSLPVAAGSPVQ
jgi:pimeloyl-ACP methyl ester carboxylesterase